MNPLMYGTSSDGLLQYVSLTFNKLEEALEIIRNNFFTDETISVAVGLSKHIEAIRELDGLVVDAAMDGVSLITVEKATGKVIGCLINKINVKENDTKGFFDKFNCKQPAAQAFLEANTELDRIVNAFDLLQTNCYLETMFIATMPEYRRRGIAKKLQEISLEIMQHLRNGNNVKVTINGKPLPLHPVPTAIVGFATSPPMKIICEKLGFTIATEIDLRKYKLQNNMLPTSAILKISPILFMCKYFN